MIRTSGDGRFTEINSSAKDGKHMGGGGWGWGGGENKPLGPLAS